MKIIATVTNCGDYIHAGGGVQSNSCVIELPEPLPPLIQKYLASVKWASEAKNRYTYKALSFSILNED